MNAWVLRAIALGSAIVAIRVLLGFAMLWWPTHSSPLRPLLFIVVVALVLGWGVADGRGDRKANPNPDDGTDLTMLWLKAAAVAGIGGGLGAWLLGLIPQVEVGGNSLVFELTSGAAFIVLVIFLPAMLGAKIGRFLADRKGRSSDVDHDSPNSGRVSSVSMYWCW